MQARFATILSFIKSQKKEFAWLIYSVVITFSVFIILDMLFPMNAKISYSRTITDTNGELLHAFLSDDDKWRLRTSLQETSPELIQAFLEKEDRFFYWHYGVNPFAILRATFNNVTRGKKTSGASTITMQVARLLEPKARTYPNKFIEAFRAVQLEWHFDKDEILEMYLNLVPYGGNIEGIKSAAQLYFGKSVGSLSLAQAITLTIIPNRPTSLKIGKNNLAITQARNEWLERFRTSDLFETQSIDDAISEPLDATRQIIPKDIPHLANTLHKTLPEKEDHVHTSIDKGIQTDVQSLLKAHSRKLWQYGIFNGAVLVVDNKTKSIVAYVGSPDFHDQVHAGQVNGVTAIRSPGSTLKPAIYSLSMDRGLYTPLQSMLDVPLNFDGYAPENYDKKFNGKVTLKNALAFSLNLPAVKVLSELGVPSLIDILKKAGFKQVERDERKLGLSLALGGCGVSLQELVGLYSAFATDGAYQPLRILKISEDTTKTVLLSQEANYILTEMLTELQRPDFPSQYQQSADLPKIAWKTGTSYGRRDAWSIGYNTQFTVGVWIGNFKGNGVQELTGASIASPLLFSIFDALDNSANSAWFQRPTHLQTRIICPVSGLTPSDFCEDIASDYFIPLVSSSATCDHLMPVFVSDDERISYCTSCLPK